MSDLVKLGREEELRTLELEPVSVKGDAEVVMR